jgi:hypothetical protein
MFKFKKFKNFGQNLVLCDRAQKAGIFPVKNAYARRFLSLMVFGFFLAV